MIKHKKIIDNYIQALIFEKPLEHKLAMLRDSIALGSCLLKNKNAWLFLNSPLMSRSEKNNLLVEFSKKQAFHDGVLNFFFLLVKNNRLFLLNDIITAAQDVQDDLTSVVNVSLRSSHPVSDDQKLVLLKELKKLGYPKVKLSATTDSSISIGFKLFVNNKVYDLSLLSVFNEFKHKILNN